MPINVVNRRAKLIVDKDFQKDYASRFVLAVVVSAALSALALFAYVHYTATVTTVFKHSRLTMMSTADFILPIVLISCMVVTIGVGVVSLFVALFLSHRIAGPAYRITADLADAAAGNLSKSVRLRQRDHLGSVAREANGLIKQLRKDVTDLKSDLKAIESATDRMPPDAVKRIENMNRVLGRYHV